MSGYVWRMNADVVHIDDNMRSWRTLCGLDISGPGWASGGGRESERPANLCARCRAKDEAPPPSNGPRY